MDKKNENINKNYPKIFFLYYLQLENFCKKNNDERFLLNLTSNNISNSDLSEKIILLKKEKIDKKKVMKEFIDFVGSLNIANKSLFWWACSVSSKNQYESSLFRNLCRFLQFTDSIEKIDKKEIIILIDNKNLVGQIKNYCIKKNIKAFQIGFKDRIFQKFHSQFFYFFGENIHFLIKNWWKKFLTNRYLKNEINNKIDSEKPYYVLRTWIDKRTFDSQGIYHDIYFGKLIPVLQKKKNTIILAVILPNFKDRIIDIKSNLSNNLIIPEEYFLGYIDYVKLLIIQFNKKIKSLNEKFNGYNVEHLVRGEIRDNLLEGKIRNNLRYYYVVKNLSKKINCKTFLHTYENHSWEKISILGLRKYSKKTFIIGFQHTTITKLLLNFFNNDEEINFIPLPDKIITGGNTPKKIMIENCNYPSNIIKEGCALRYHSLLEKNISNEKEKNKTYNILIGTAASIDESVRVIDFVYNTIKKEKYTITFRPHPLLSFDKIKEKIDFELGTNFKVSTKKNVTEDINNSDIFIYTQTSLCIEAIMTGTPLIYLDIDEIYNDDPLFQCESLKWQVSQKKELLSTINKIYNMSSDDFKKQYKSAKNYLEKYFYPITEERLNVFIEK